MSSIEQKMIDLDNSFSSPKLNADKFKVGLAMGAK
jgi:hypothetical protein